MNLRRTRIRIAKNLTPWILLTLALIPQVSVAAGVGKFALGLNLGLAFPNTSSNAVSLGFGATYRMSPVIGMKFFYQGYGVTIDSKNGTNQVNSEASQGLIGLEGDYYFPGGPGQFHAGLKLGSASTTLKSTATDGTNTITIDSSHSNLFFAPTLGYDQPIGVFSLGGELSYILGLGDSPPKAILLLATLKFWF